MYKDDEEKSNKTIETLKYANEVGIQKALEEYKEALRKEPVPDFLLDTNSADTSMTQYRIC